MLELDGVTKVFKTGMFGEVELTAVSRRELRRASRARSSP